MRKLYESVFVIFIFYEGVFTWSKYELLQVSVKKNMKEMPGKCRANAEQIQMLRQNLGSEFPLGFFNQNATFISNIIERYSEVPSTSCRLFFSSFVGEKQATLVL